MYISAWRFVVREREKHGPLQPSILKAARAPNTSFRADSILNKQSISRNCRARKKPQTWYVLSCALKIAKREKSEVYKSFETEIRKEQHGTSRPSFQQTGDILKS
jgi:hypothetical protein